MGDLSSNFSRREFSCKCGCGMDTVDAELIMVLENLRWGQGVGGKSRAITVSSGCRCEEHNRNEGGGDNSQHLIGKAADIAVYGVTPKDVAEYLDKWHPDQYGIGRYETFTHIDVRSKMARW